MFARGGRAAGRHARDDRSRRGPAKRDARALADEAGVVSEPPVGSAPDGSGSPAAAGPGAATPPADEPGAAAAGQPTGPYDISQAPAGVGRLDLGSLQIPSVPGVEVRVQANPEGVIQQVYLVHGESVLQLGAFAAPRTESLWDEVREEIRAQLSADGVAVQEAAGSYGTELRARVRTQQGMKDLRFVGIDGPRWMVRAVYQGPAAVDLASAGPLEACLRGLVVDRGQEARPAKEALPLRLSAQLAEQVQARARASAGGTNGVAPGPVPVTGAGAIGQAGSGPDGDSPRRRPSPRPRRD